MIGTSKYPREGPSLTFLSLWMYPTGSANSGSKTAAVSLPPKTQPVSRLTLFGFSQGRSYVYSWSTLEAASAQEGAIYDPAGTMLILTPGT